MKVHLISLFIYVYVFCLFLKIKKCSSVINRGAVVESGGGQNRTFVPGPLPSSLPGHPVSSAAHPASRLGHFRSLLHTKMWAQVGPLVSPSQHPHSPRPLGRGPFCRGLLTCPDHDPPPLRFSSSGCRGLKGAKCVVSFHAKAFVHIASSDWNSVLQCPLPPPRSLPLILHRWFRCHFLQEAGQVRGVPAAPGAAAHLTTPCSLALSPRWLPGAALCLLTPHCIPLHVAWHKVGFNLICWMSE